jgi:hypothetical protein
MNREQYMRMTPEAASAVRRLMGTAEQQIKRDDLVPAITWIFNRKGEASNPGPMLGLIERARALESTWVELCSDGDLIVYDGLPSELSAQYHDHVLDFREGGFEFVAAE